MYRNPNTSINRPQQPDCSITDFLYQKILEGRRTLVCCRDTDIINYLLDGYIFRHGKDPLAGTSCCIRLGDHSDIPENLRGIMLNEKMVSAWHNLNQRMYEGEKQAMSKAEIQSHQQSIHGIYCLIDFLLRINDMCLDFLEQYTHGISKELLTHRQKTLALHPVQSITGKSYPLISELLNILSKHKVLITVSFIAFCRDQIALILQELYSLEKSLKQNYLKYNIILGQMLDWLLDEINDLRQTTPYIRNWLKELHRYPGNPTADQILTIIREMRNNLPSLSRFQVQSLYKQIQSQNLPVFMTEYTKNQSTENALSRLKNQPALLGRPLLDHSRLIGGNFLELQDLQRWLAPDFALSENPCPPLRFDLAVTDLKDLKEAWILTEGAVAPNHILPIW